MVVPPSKSVSQAKSRVAVLSRKSVAATPEQIASAKAALAEAKLAAYIERTLAEAPPLTDRQRTALAELLRPVRIAAGGDAL